MPRFLADECFNEHILDGLFAREPSLDIVRASEVGLVETPDHLILEWAAREARVVLTHDAQTMPGYAFDRVRAGLTMPGVIFVPQSVAVATAIDDLLIYTLAGQDSDFDDQVRYVPLP
jgi:uncharacterized protein DUF5615